MEDRRLKMEDRSDPGQPGPEIGDRESELINGRARERTKQQTAGQRAAREVQNLAPAFPGVQEVSKIPIPQPLPGANERGLSRTERVAP